MPLVKVWIHLVWSTKDREPLLNAETRLHLFRHIRENARAKGIFVDFTGGYTDHVLCLVSLGTGFAQKGINREAVELNSRGQRPR